MIENILPIGEYQMENLLKNRVPFCLVQIETDLASLHKGPEAQHIERYSKSFSVANWQEEFKKLLVEHKENHYPLDYPIICLSVDEKISKEIASAFDDSNYKNVYYVLDGIAGLKS
jgi:hypothetical protein